jgi:hypothetical protein
MTPVRLILELEGGEPIAGWVDSPLGPRERFTGLLELVAMLDRVRSGDDDPGSEDDTPGR